MSAFSVLAGLLAAVIAAMTTYLVSRRQHSGRIDTTEAAKLWTESTEMRQELRSEVIGLRSELVTRHDEIVTLRERDVECRAKLAALTRRMRRLEQKQGQ